ncbi:MAG: hypothetical protein KGH61_04210 [Candidatus Micrarchaeota archaeon]|nr:hypothetical protein [Candidatus Micrarchaeota archaeon]MDE1848123.1 hypothetical protein [Candidatus Micrarchaeota archaeon]MDE1863930.1 hypothetical protein [Candidatus Micrarchaeota archaeon]
MPIGIDNYNISLDLSNTIANLSFVSHAHTDHTNRAKNGASILASKETKALIEARKKVSVRLIDMPANIELLDAGHILGSKQLFIDSAEFGYSVVYTGDYQMQPTPTAKKIEVKKADIAIVDSTYPDPEIVFDSREEVVETIQYYVKRKLENGVVIFGAYSLGKAQELVKIMNDIGITPAVSKGISKLNRVYGKFGMNLGYASTYEDDVRFESIVKENFVGIVETQRLRELGSKLSSVYNKRVYTAVATGWAKSFRFDTDVQFPLSDHADFRQALEYLQGVEPKVVYAVGKEGELMAHNLKKSGYNAKSLSASSEFCGLEMVRY